MRKNDIVRFLGDVPLACNICLSKNIEGFWVVKERTRDGFCTLKLWDKDIDATVVHESHLLKIGFIITEEEITMTKLMLKPVPKNECGCATDGICTCGKEICPDCKKCLDCCICEKAPAFVS